MGVYGLAWTPAFIFKVIWTPVPNFWSMGPLAPYLKISIFAQNLTILVSMDLPGPLQPLLKWFGPGDQIFGPRALWPQIQKFAIFSQNPPKMGVYGITWTPAIILGWFGPWGQIFAPRALWLQIQKFVIFSQNPQNLGVYGLTWTPAFIFEVIWTLGPNFGSKGSLAQN